MLLCVSANAVAATTSPRTLQFHGIMQHAPILILIDSSSTTSFASHSIRHLHPPASIHPIVLSVKDANGEEMHCTVVLSGATWSIGQCVFQHDLKLLSLGHYDLILGMD